jgi:CO dehydrogenase/acetyl-CoA synthase delta subunit
VIDQIKVTVEGMLQNERIENLEEIETEKIEIDLLEMKTEVKRVKKDEASYVRTRI